MQRQPELNYGRRLRAAAMFHHGGRSIPALAHDFRVNRAAIGDATREFPKSGQTRAIYQQMTGGT